MQEFCKDLLASDAGGCRVGLILNDKGYLKISDFDTLFIWPNFCRMESDQMLSTWLTFVRMSAKNQ